MTALFDDDPVRAAEQATAAWVAYEKALDHNLHELRERLTVVVVARLLGEDDQAAITAADEFTAALDPDLVVDMLRYVLWHGAKSVEDDARARLLALRDAWNVEPIEALR